MSVNTELSLRHAAAVSCGVGTKSVYIERAENAELWDVDGKRYVDFAAGIAVVNTGHRHPKVMAAVAEQLEKYTHSCFQVTPYESYIRLAERLNEIVPIDTAAKTLLVTTGAEAVENAIKVCRAYTGRSAVIAFSGGFHGRTFMGMALTGKVNPYKKGFGPLPGEIFHAPFPDAYKGVSVETSMAALNQIVASEIEAGRVAAIIVEPIQGEGGFIPSPPGFLKALRDFCDLHGICLVADEIQAGMARTGEMFGFDHAGVKPDVMTLAKGLAGGFPLAAVVGKAEIMDASQVGGLGGTYAGSPVAIAAANAVLDIIEDEKLCSRAAEIGEIIYGRLGEIASHQGMETIGDIRGPGAMVAFELVKDRESKEANTELAVAIVAAAEQRGLMLLTCGTRGNVIRLLPPLTISNEVLEEGLDILIESIETAISSL